MINKYIKVLFAAPKKMNKKDLDALNELYLSVYGGEQLSEGPMDSNSSYADAFTALNKPTPAQIAKDKQRAAKEKSDRATNQRAQLGVVRTNNGYVANSSTAYDPEKSAQAVGLANRLNKEGGLGKYTKTTVKSTANSRLDSPIAGRGPKGNEVGSPVKPITSSPPSRTPAGSPLSRPTAGSSPAAKPSGVVLARKNNVTGTLDKSTGKFTEKNWTDTETQRYQTRAAQNAPKPSSPTPAASAPKPAIGKLGNTSFERRTPTSAELRAAQGARDKGASPEKALQAAQKTNLPTTGPSPAIPDLKSVSADLTRANPSSTSSQIAGASQGIKPATPGSNSINNKKPITPMKEMSSYEWPSAKTIRDIAGAYASIYEAKKKDQDQDGDNDFADVRVARMIASGMSKAEAIAAVKNKSYNEEVELWVNELLEEGYDLSEYTWEDMFEIYEATAMTRRGYDETEIRNKIAKSTGGGEAADRATALAARQTFRGGGSARDTLARRQRGDFRKTTSSSPGLHGYGHKSDDPAVKAKQAARGAQRGVLTPREKKQLNREAYEAYEFVASYLLENNFAETLNDANVIIENMSENWFEIIMEEKKPLPVAKMKRKESELLDNEERQLQALRTDVGSKERKARMKERQE